MRVWLERLCGQFRRRQMERDLEEEIRFHLEAEVEEGVRRGLNPAAARAAALRSFGGVSLTKEVYRETAGIPAVETVLRDLRYSLRVLRKSPGFTLAAVLSLALGIGANSAIFSLLNAVILRQLPVAAPDRLVQFVYTIPKSGPDNWNSNFGFPQFERFQAQAQTLSGIFSGTWLGRLNLVLRHNSDLAEGYAATPNIFSVLGVVPQTGRFFSPADRPGATEAVLSDRYWRSRFGADPSVIGSAVTINQVPFTIIGVAPPQFLGISTGTSADVWVPLRTLDRLQPNRYRWTEPFTSWLQIVGRLRPGVSLPPAQSELDLIYRRLLVEQLGASERRNSESLQTFVRLSQLRLRTAAGGIASGVRERYGRPLVLLLCIAGIVLLITCANIANLLLARASNRSREIAVRMSLGAARGRIVRQLLTESLVLAAMGGVLALLVAWWGSMGLVRMISTGDSPVVLDIHPDWRMFAFTAAVSLCTGVLFGLAPALRGTRVDPGPALKEASSSSGRLTHSLDRILVAAQIALSVVLITGAGLFVHTLNQLWSVDAGYDRENVFLFSVDTRLAGYPVERAGTVYRDILRRLQSLPEARIAAASIVRPVDDQFDLTDQINEVDGLALPDREDTPVSWNAVSPAYFAAVSTPILLGRDFDLRDDETAPKVVIVNESLARRVFPGQNPLGHRLADATVVGMVKDSLYLGVRDRPKPVLYRPLFQHGREQEYRWGFVSFEIRYRSGANLMEQARREVAAVDRNLPIFHARTLRAQTEQSLLQERLLAALSTGFGGLALVLACLGLYGVMAYAVSRRTKEIGLRLALGAQPGHVSWLVLRETLWLTVAGIAAGVPLALWAARYAGSLLFGVQPADPAALGVSIALVTMVAAVAACLPVRRAVRVDPVTALRCD